MKLLPTMFELARSLERCDPGAHSLALRALRALGQLDRGKHGYIAECIFVACKDREHTTSYSLVKIPAKRFEDEHDRVEADYSAANRLGLSPDVFGPEVVDKLVDAFAVLAGHERTTQLILAEELLHMVYTKSRQLDQQQQIDRF